MTLFPADRPPPSGGSEAEGGLSEQDWSDLTAAVDAFERETFATTLNRTLGKRIRSLTSFAPKGMGVVASRAVDAALRAALRAAIATLRRGAVESDPDVKIHSSVLAHRAAVAVSGAAGGALGLAMLPIELPISTTLMFRSIADIARAEGEDLRDPAVALACLEVFALDGSSEQSMDHGYFAVRAALAKAVGSAAIFALGRGALEETAPALARFMAIVASRFGAAMGQKLAAQAVPILGAAGGAAVNYAFMHHFQTMAKAHFTVRRLERMHGPECVREAYERLKAARAGSRAKPVASPAIEGAVK
jgi:hypothetical protein